MHGMDHSALMNWGLIPPTQTYWCSLYHGEQFHCRERTLALSNGFQDNT